MPVGLLEGRTASERASHARLLLELDELTRGQWATLDLYAVVRGITTLSAARRSIFRLKKTLAEHGVELEVVTERGAISAHFGTREIAEWIEPDLRAARELVRRLDARRGGLDHDDDEPAGETEVISPQTISLEYRSRAKSFAWIARKHGIGKGRLRRILVSTGPIRAPRLRRRVEERRPAALVARALDAADRGALLDEIAAILDCSRRTARRFLRRYGRTLRSGRPRAS
jgi:hypothetical protein